MFCKNCGVEIDDAATFCDKCGAEVEPVNACECDKEIPEEAACETPEEPEKEPAPKKGFKKWLLAIIIPAAIVLIAGIIVIIAAVSGSSGSAALHKEIMDGEWIRTDDEGVLILSLDFDENEVEYEATGVYVSLEETIATMPYKVVDEDTIMLTEFDREITVTIEVDPETGTRTLTCEPAMTSLDTVEWWFQFDD